MRFLQILSCLAVLLINRGSASAAPAQPNIIVIMADDLGHGDVSCYGAAAVRIPAIDRLAHEGVRFISGYCSASTCTLSRFHCSQAHIRPARSEAFVSVYRACSTAALKNLQSIAP
ncbi:MAG: sulfatase-like hydrolase/transferase [Limisphaerales bacterium]